MVTNTCAPMKTTSPTTRMVMGAPAGPRLAGSRGYGRSGGKAVDVRGFDRPGDNAFTLAIGDQGDEGNTDETICACTAGTSARACRGAGAGLAQQNGADHRAVRAGLDPRHGWAIDRRPYAA